MNTATNNERKKIAIVGSNIMNLGFGISGVKKLTSAYKNQEKEVLEKQLFDLFQDPEISVIVISESLSRNVKDRKLLNLIDTSLLPVVVEIPDYNEPETNEDSLRRLIKRAIGIDLRVERI